MEALKFEFTTRLAVLASLLYKAELYRHSLIISLKRQQGLSDKLIYLQYSAEWQYYHLQLKTTTILPPLRFSIYLLSSDNFIRDHYLDDFMRQKQEASEDGLKRF